MQLSFAIFPLVMFTSDRKKMGEFVNPLWLKLAGYGVCFLIAGLNVYLLYATVKEHLGTPGLLILGLFAVAGVLFALWVKFGYRDAAPESGISTATS
jgi:manganese transport protein